MAECSCGLAYLSPRPRPELISRLYDQGYFSGETSGVGYASYLEDSRRLAADPESLYSAVANELDQRYGLAGRRLLDVGAATGVLLSVAKAKGAQVLGVEPSADAARAGQELFGVEIRPGYLAEAALPEESFDMVTLLEVLEHPLSPRALLRDVHRVLKPGGIIALSTPNFGLARFRGQRYIGLRVSYEHLYYWTAGSLTRLFDAEGFRAEGFAGTNWTFVKPRPEEGLLKRAARRAAGHIIPRLPRDLGATTLIAFARRR